MDALNALEQAVEVVKIASTSVARRIAYLWKLEETIDTLRRKNELDLIDRENDIRREIRGAEAQTRISLLSLLDHIELVGGRVNDITRSFEECYTCFFSSSRLKLAKRVLEVTQELDRLLGETSKFSDEVVVDRSPTRAEIWIAPTLVGDAMVKRNLDAVLGSLRDPLICKVGVYGMCGSGKTSTMKNIHNQLVNTKDFNKIIWVTVSEYFNLYRVQRHIAEQLNLDLSSYADEEHRAGLLFDKLKQTNKLLIIFDHVWSLIPLEKVGIPEPNIENKCKIVLMTRSLAICRAMETDLDIKLELLSNEVAWNLFVRNAGNQVLNSELQPLAKEVVRKCGGLPLAIISISRALRNKDVSFWRVTVHNLWNSYLRMDEAVIRPLRFGYNHLRNDTMRKCFLYCAMFPEGYRIGRYNMVTLWMAEKYINEDENLETERDEGYKIWKELLDACMIEEDGSMQYCLRDLAIHIMGEEDELVKAGLQLTVLPSSIKWGEAKKISLMRNEIDSLPNRLNCPKLSTLLLRHNPISQPLSSFFFSQMPTLQVLDLSYTGIIELPSSFSDLLNLRALFLQHCGALEKIPSVAKLQKLWMVNLSYTSIKQVPQGLEELTNLTSLSLAGCKSLEKIPSLVKLEKLQQFH